MRLVVLTAVAMLAFAANSVLNRMALADGGMEAQGFAVIRLLAGAATLAGLVLARRAILGTPVWPGAQGRLAGVAGLLVYLFGFSVAYTQLAAGTGALVLFGAVQITMFAGALVAGELVRPARWIGAGMAFAGLCLLVAPSLGAGSLAAMAAMGLAGVGWGIYSLAGRGAADPLAATAWNFVLAVPLALLIWVMGAGGVVPVMGPGVWLAVLSGAVTSGMGYALWYRLVPQLGAARAAVAQLTVPVIAAAGGLALIGEGVTLHFALSAAVVLAGVAVASR